MGRIFLRRQLRDLDYFLARSKIEIDEETGCHIWLGAQNDDGYGNIREWWDGKWRVTRVHAYFWRLYNGAIPDEMEVSHSCHHRLCVNTTHLELVTHVQNMQFHMFDYKFSSIEKDLVMRLLQEGFDHSYIADKLMAPRPAINRLTKRLPWRELDFS